MKRFAMITVAALGALLATAPGALAQTCSPTGTSGNCNCVSNIGGPATINGNLVVPAGASCMLTNVTVTGNVQVGKGASTRFRRSLIHDSTLG
jgi:hypothetical protein